KETGTEIKPGALGAAALGKETGCSPAGVPDEMEKPSTGGPAARAEPASSARQMLATTRRRISLRLWRVEAPEPLARAQVRAPAPLHAPALPRFWQPFRQPRAPPSVASARVLA